ncbi:sigma-54 factor interaction domain-containing protein [Candidatus Aminicenantes bacterium AH-873-B07]|jgi:transcriptional regulator with PAS, ATPase and Fis domain|nr:sigma-54 factor interaction domain-containing protein [Candidatus Aminicenantes bacterium AH-873-B07]
MSGLKELVGKSGIIGEIRKFIKKASSVEYHVLLLGETGVGKTLIAHLIHLHSKRKGGPFLHQNCSNIQETLFESELFGHEKGSFTGAEKRKIGKIELANGGTLLLDEIADLNPQNQAKLLLFLESGKFFRIGGTKEKSKYWFLWRRAFIKI